MSKRLRDDDDDDDNTCLGKHQRIVPVNPGNVCGQTLSFFCVHEHMLDGVLERHAFQKLCIAYCTRAPLKSPSKLLSFLSSLRTTIFNITELTLVHSYLTDDELCVLCETLTDNTSVIKLNLEGNQFRQRGIEALSSWLCTNSTLTTLSLARNKLECRGATTLSKALSTPTSGLLWLDLNACCIGIAGIGSIALALTLPTCKLEALNVSNNQLKSIGGRAIAAALNVNTSLVRLTLCGIGDLLGDDSGFGDALKVNTTLQELDISNCLGSIHACTAIAKSLSSNQTLRKLTMMENHNTSKVIKNLFLSLATNTTLTHLDLNWAHIEDQTAIISNALSVNTTLKHLQLLSATGLSSKIKLMVETIAATNTSLTSMTLFLFGKKWFPKLDERLATTKSNDFMRNMTLFELLIPQFQKK